MYDAELHAMQEGLQWISAAGWPRTKIFICADNQSTLACLTTSNPANSEYTRNALWTIKGLLAEGWRVGGLRTPTHCGIPGNELADSLEKQGAQATLRTYSNHQVLDAGEGLPAIDARLDSQAAPRKAIPHQTIHYFL